MRRLGEDCVDQLIAASRDDPNLWLLDGDLADSYGANRFEAQCPERFVMCGIAEQNMVSMAAGMAAMGARPWVFSFAAFLVYRAADQIRVSISQTGLPVTLVGSHAGGCADRNGKSHMATGDIALIGALPGIDVWSPADRAGVVHSVTSIRRAERPAYLRLPREMVADLAIPQGGDIRWQRDDSPLLIVCSGLSAHWAEETARQVAEKMGTAPSILAITRIKPFPAEAVAIIGEAQRIIVIEDHVRTGGLADAMTVATGRLPDNWFGWPDDWTGSGESSVLRKLCGLDADAITTKLL